MKSTKTVAELLESKGHDIYSVGPDALVFEAIRTMSDKGVGALLVMDGAKAVGVVSERDYARKMILQGRTSDKTYVREIMTSEVIFCQPDLTVQECMALMTENHVRHLPVKDGDTLCGVVTIGDMVKATIAEQEFVISQLESYISQ
ncbi:MAG: CBS domain-containing protein [Lentisphaeria bacterium]|nr:CBS domain-containing protein [Lentisphaeria bacterium]